MIIDYRLIEFYIKVIFARLQMGTSPCTGGSSNTKMFSTISAPSSGEKGYENLLLVEIQIPSVRKSSVSFVLQCSSVVYS